MKNDAAYGRTPLGQLIHDMAFARLTPRWIARKHKMPIADVRKYLALPAIKTLIRKNTKRKRLTKAAKNTAALSKRVGRALLQKGR